MYKLIGGFTLIFSVGLLGINKYNSLMYRAENLEKLLSALRLLGKEIAFGRHKLRDALIISGNAEKLPLFIEIAENMPTDNIQNTFLQFKGLKKMSLTQGDIKILSDFFRDLGKSSSKLQTENIEYTISLLTDAKEKAEYALEHSGKLYRKIGFLCGILIALALI